MVSLPQPYSSDTAGSLVYYVFKEWLPSILSDAIDSFDKTWSLFVQTKSSPIHNHGNASILIEVKEIIQQLKELHQQLTRNQELTPFPEDSEELQLWNKQLVAIKESSNNLITWFDGPWLYVECYMYRRIRHLLERSQYFTEFDPFEAQKREAAKSGVKMSAALANYLKNFDVNQNGKKDIEPYLEMALWGNRCDLLLSSDTQTQENQSQVQDLVILRQKILCNDLPKLVELIYETKTKEYPAIVDIILDNAGFELFTDLCMSDVLTKVLPEGSRIRFHVKIIPWFVSDVMTKDIHWFLDFLLEAKEFPILVDLSKQWLSNLKLGQWAIIEDDYWTLGYDYSVMQSIKPSLYNKLSEANIIIFKGDLNYRKLTGDLVWEKSASFKEVLQGFWPTNLVSMRVIKTEVVVGLESDDVCQSLPQDWFSSGEYGLVQLVTI